jgi:hypothetical protein
METSDMPRLNQRKQAILKDLLTRATARLQEAGVTPEEAVLLARLGVDEFGIVDNGPFEPDAS